MRKRLRLSGNRKTGENEQAIPCYARLHEDQPLEEQGMTEEGCYAGQKVVEAYLGEPHKCHKARL